MTIPHNNSDYFKEKSKPNQLPRDTADATWLILHFP